jgi:hypothetical protein
LKQFLKKNGRSMLVKGHNHVERGFSLYPKMEEAISATITTLETGHSATMLIHSKNAYSIVVLPEIELAARKVAILYCDKSGSSTASDDCNEMTAF